MLDPTIAQSYDAGRSMEHRPFRAVCYSPFNSMFFDTLGVVRACCVNWQYPLGDLKKQRLDEIWFGPRTRRLRESMLQYDMRIGCEQCQWQIENGNFTNDRHTFSSVHAFKYDSFPIVKRDERDFWPTNLEFNLSNVCNLECVTCNGDLSSLIRANREQRPPLPHVYTDQFFKDLEPYLEHVRNAQFLGGEPFLIQEHYRVWELMKAAGKMWWVGVVTNGTVYNDRVEGVLESLPVSLAMSIDGATKETFEAIRVNAKYDVFMANCQKFLQYHRAHGRRLCFTFTLSRLNQHEFADFLLFAESLDCDVSVCALLNPERFCLYKLEDAELRSVIAGLERRDDEMQRSLKANLQMWTSALGNLRNELKGRQRHAPASVAAVTDAAENGGAPRRLRMSDGFAGVLFISQEESAQAREQALADLGSWSGAGVDELLSDLDDAVTAVGEMDGGVLEPGAAVIGRSLGDVRAHIHQHLGSSLDSTELKVNERRFDRVLRSGDGGESPGDVRAIVLPRFGANGNLVGLRVLLARRVATATR